ncbi:hypothetical protein, partial [Fusicatenibacter saccharivorans]|uniref:hypothetical protein n=1 Tax=Fusicatenibacter saccharivorans TaxID=1150298 RepID=UPI002E8DF4EB
IKGPPNDIYCIIEEPSKHYFTEKVSYSPPGSHQTDQSAGGKSGSAAFCAHPSWPSADGGW